MSFRSLVRFDENVEEERIDIKVDRLSLEKQLGQQTEALAVELQYPSGLRSLPGIKLTDTSDYLRCASIDFVHR